jgi:hypothetical protein
VSVGGPGLFLPTVARAIASKTSIGQVSCPERGMGTGMENVGRIERIGGGEKRLESIKFSHH